MRDCVGKYEMLSEACRDCNEFLYCKAVKNPKSKEAFQVFGDMINRITQEARDCIANACKEYIRFGGLMTAVDDQKLWRYAGTHVNNMKAYCSGELGISYSKVRSYIDIYKKFAAMIDAEPGYRKIGVTRLSIIAPIVNKGGDPEQWLEKALTLPVKGFDDAVREARGLITTDSCDHPSFIVIERCTVCGWRRKVE